jgi:hypothetical protein
MSMENAEQRTVVDHELTKGAHESGVEYLSEKEIAKLLWLSFKYSQGSSGTQRAIFKYLHQRHPVWRMDDSTREKVVKTLIPPAAKFIGEASTSHFPHGSSMYGEPTPEAEVETQLDLQLGDFQTYLSGGLHPADTVEPPDRAMVLTELAVGMADRDTKFGDGMRPRKQEGEMNGSAYNPNKDAFLSHLVWYGFLNRPTEHKDYDQMFADVVAYLREQGGVFNSSEIDDYALITDCGLRPRIMDGASREKDWEEGIVHLGEDIDAIVEKWNERHPDFIVEDWRTSPDKDKAEE